MARHGKMLIALAVSLLVLTLAAAELQDFGPPECGRQNGHKKCRDNHCCSKDGYCGEGNKYCGNGCQSQCHHSGVEALGQDLGPPECGRQNGHKKCRDNHCCSKDGYCGEGNSYCGNGCQSQCHHSGVEALGQDLGPPECGRQNGHKKCRDNHCCSKDGYCGEGNNYCGNGCQSQCHHSGVEALGQDLGPPECGRQNGHKKCRDNHCCSKDGYCGEGNKYCGNGCQSQCHHSGVEALGQDLGPPECGRQNGHKKCRDNHCCSKDGYCGEGNKYCGNGCQSQCHHSDVEALGQDLGPPECGRQNGHKRCHDNHCCSKDGYCGEGNKYCGNGCQSQCHHSDVEVLGQDLGPPECGRQNGHKRCHDNHCCSKDGYCGEGNKYCGNGCQSQCHHSDVEVLGQDLGPPECGRQNGHKRCHDNHCCSKDGYCGEGNKYCGNGCQSQCHHGGGLSDTTGKASYYSTYIPSACYGNDVSHFPRNRHMAAVSDGNPNLWKNGQGCGNHYRIRCQGNGCRNGDTITIKVVDRCPNGCQGRVFDLSEEAFGAIADKNAGVIKVQYEPVNSEDAIPWDQEKLIVELK